MTNPWDAPEKAGEEPRSEPSNRAQVVLAVFVAILAGSGILYRWLVLNRLDQSAALFIGLPTLLAFALVLTPKAKSPIGMMMKGVTLALLMSGILFGEGFACILMAAPLFYLVGLIIGVIVTYLKGPGGPAVGIALLPFAPMALEGVTEELSFEREETITVTKIVNGTPEEIERVLESFPDLDRELPFFLRLGFPRPLAAEGHGLNIGDRRIIHFAGAKDLTLEVNAHGPGSVRFVALSDTSPIAHWLTWRDASISWRAIDRETSEVTCVQRYRRDLHPMWYFGPWERYGVGLAVEYLVGGVATPRDGS